MTEAKQRIRTDWSNPAYWQLNAEQSKPFAHNNHCAVIACPGSGKTRLMMGKMVRLIEEAGTENVMAVTFTKAAVREMKERLAKVIGKTDAAKANIATFHGYAYQQLKGIYGRNKPKFLNESEEASIILRSRDRLNLALGNDEAIEIVHRLKRVIELPKPDIVDTEGIRDLELYADYRRTVMGMMALDQDSMITEVLRRYHLPGAEGLRPYPARFLLVDEYQDSDMVQVEWILAHVKNGTQVTVVGDDDQSIYGFRNALGVSAYRILANRIGEDNIRLYRLQTNYRCAKEVVEKAGSVIGGNRERIDKAFIAYQQTTGSVRKRVYGDRGDEAEAVVDHFEENGENLAVLSRTKAWLAGVELVARSRGIPVRSPAGDGFFLEQAHVRRTLAGFQFGIDTNNRIRLVEAMTGLGVSRKGVSQLEEKLRQMPHDHAILDEIYQRNFFDDFDRETATFLREGRKALGEWVSACEESEAGGLEGEALWHAVERLGEQFVGYCKNNERRDDIRLLCEILGKKMRGTLQERIQALTKEKEVDKNAPGLSLMTMHGSKGLEFPEVWIIGCSDGHVPKLDETDNLEEERRLLYVAMTRAERGLTLSAVRKAGSGKEKDLEVSRFFDEFEETKEFRSEGYEDTGNNRQVVDGEKVAG